MKLGSNHLNLGAILFMWLISAGCENEKQVATTETQDAARTISAWITTPDKSQLFKEQPSKLTFGKTGNGLDIVIDSTKTFQTIDGFGYSLTGGSAYLLHTKLSSEKRAALLKELFDHSGGNIGVSYLRISVGASDLDARVFSYNDMPKGRTDENMKSFSIVEDEKHLIPVLKEILAINPEIRIMASPWSAPAWMKDNQSPRGGSLKKKAYGPYALYLAKYIQAMDKHGIRIDALTLQNEPENPKNNPSMVMTAEEQADFVKNHLGPLFESQGIDTKIVVFDHNCDHPEYPITILNDEEAKQYIDGSAFHLYLGEIDAMGKVHDAHPDRHVYFTEQWTSPNGSFDGDLKWHTRNLTIGASRNWSRTVLEWNLAADAQFNPHTDQGGCTECLGALTIDNGEVTRNVSYYIIAHASKFVRPGATRIGSSMPEGLPNVAFVTPEGKRVLIVLNESAEQKDFNIVMGGEKARATLPAGSVATYVW